MKSVYEYTNDDFLNIFLSNPRVIKYLNYEKYMTPLDYVCENKKIKIETPNSIFLFLNKK